jgi:hypothetical protein
VSVSEHVNVVPRDEVAGQIPDPVVRTGVAHLRTQQATSRASGLPVLRSFEQARLGSWAVRSAPTWPADLLGLSRQSTAA